MSTTPPLSLRFRGNWSDDELRSLLTVDATKIENLSALGPTEAQSRLETALKQVVVPTSQMVSGMKYLIERAGTYCDGAYPNERAVLGLIYGSESTYSPENRRATCITGLAGVGKSVLFDSFMRLFGGPIAFDMPGHAGLELRPCWRMTIRGRAGFSSLVLPHFRIKDTISPSRIYETARSEAAAQGIALILADEFQFISSTNANTMMASLLYRLAEIGPPVIYACNFSMVNALWRRPQQDRDRLLLNPIVLKPENTGPEWQYTVEGMLAVAEEYSGLNSVHAVQVLHDYTFGIKRCLRSLLSLAYMQMRRTREQKVLLSHVTAAYHSLEYAAMREDVENLVQGTVSPKLLRKDLACPLVDNTSALDGPPKKEKDIVPTQAMKGATHAALLSMVAPEIRALLLKMDDQAFSPEKRIPKALRKPHPSVENLLGGAERFASRDKKDE
ncbi:hypothetical protein [Arenimonas malthae]|uniref:hypothetical protein n=1 Tax=Arenimonas malthae TaxID=354197 RepID=UPI0012EB6B96|nr:hypothetical protein [Arenimonas malthae]